MMTLDRTFLFSKLARRIFWLFVLCALLPIAVLSFVSVFNVTSQLNEQSRRLLRQTSHEEGMNILEHLTSLETDMRLIGSVLEPGAQLNVRAPRPAIPEKLEDRLKGLEIVTDQGTREILYGKVAVALEFSANEKKFLHSGKTLLSTRSCSSPAPCVFLSQELSEPDSGHGTLVAEIQPSHLWDADTLPPLTNLCVLDDTGRPLFCPQGAPAQLSSKPASALSDQFDWSNGEREYLSDYWSMPLKPNFFASHWTIIASEAKSDILAPLSHFERTFLFTVLLAFWVVLLVSLIQIRRNLVPLARLQEGTRRITSGDLQARVTVPGGDEFAELASSFNFMATRIEKQVNSLKTINEIDRAILSSWNIEQVVDALIVRLHGLFRYDFVTISLLGPDSSPHTLTYVSAAGEAEEKQIRSIMLSAREVAALGPHPKIVTLDHGESCPSYLAPLVQRQMHCFLVVPILLKQNLSAIISLGRGPNSTWSGEDAQQALQLADQVAVAISNAQLVSELKQLHLGTLTALARAIDAKSHWTAGHSERVTNRAVEIARSIGLPEHDLEIIYRGGLVHDIGKIGTPVAILDKPGKLSDEELEQMREHVQIGARIMEPIPGFAECMPIILEHHERVDGSGYPKGLVGDEISLHARIFAVADCYDALISDRPYRRGMSPRRVREIIRAGIGTQFDAVAAETFLNLLEQENRHQEAADISLSLEVVS